MSADIRWKQRFQNFEKAFRMLEKSVAILEPNETERAGVIQFFEMAFELAWKLLKDFLEKEGHQVKSPRETLKQALQNGLIEDGHTWIEALEKRNMTTHMVDEKTIIVIENNIQKKYFPLLKKLHEFFTSKIS